MDRMDELNGVGLLPDFEFNIKICSCCGEDFNLKEEGKSVTIDQVRKTVRNYCQKCLDMDPHMVGDL